VDLNGDGHLDILSGSYSRMEKKMAGLFQVLYGDKDGTFKKAEAVQGVDGEPLIIPTKNDDQITDCICTRPFAVDWDGDGNLDIVTGNFAGTFYWFKGEGKGKFDPKPEVILAGKSPLRNKGAHSDPFIVDWDADGDLDIVSGTASGGVYWAENAAGKGKLPEMKDFKQLIAASKHEESVSIVREKDLKGPGHDTRVWVADVNGDGKLDVLVGDRVTLVEPAEGVSEDEMKAKLKDWEKDFEKAMKALAEAQQNAEKKNDDKKDKDEKKKDEKEEDPLAKATKEYHRVYELRNKFMKEEMTGYVWLYLRK
jgi:hypothetical protein